MTRLPGLVAGILAALAAACGACETAEDAETVGIYGYMMVGVELTDPPMALTGGTLDAYDDAGELLSLGEEPWPEDYPGYYRVRELPPGEHVQLTTGARGDARFVPTSHQAWTASANLYVYDGELFILETAWLESFLALSGKDGVGASDVDEVIDPDDEETGGFLLGVLADPEAGEGTRVRVHTGDDDVEAVYLDETGVARADLVATGPGGWFAAFGIPSGPAEVVVTTADGEDLEPAPVLFLEDGCTSLVDLEVLP